MRKTLVLVNLALILVATLGNSVTAFAAGNSVVINEVAWAGSADSSSDEWIELYNNSSQTVDLTGWQFKDDGVVNFTFPASLIAPYSYFLLEDSENAVADVQSDLIYNMSLANSGDSLQLLDASGNVVDTVNGSGGPWYAGSSTDHSTMERIDPSQGDIASNFASSTGNIGHGRSGTALTGTPKQQNSVASFADISPKIYLDLNSVSGSQNDTVTVPVKVQNVDDLFAYGLEINYDPAILQFQNVTQGNFLNAAGDFETSFQSGLENGQPGKLLVAEARTITPKVGQSGAGTLFSINFKILATDGTDANLSVGSSSFASDTAGDLSVPINGGTFTVGPVAPALGPVTNLQVAPDSQRYAIDLNWEAPASGADSYLVERKDAHGNYQTLGSVTAPGFVDQDGVDNGGNIIPNVDYTYRVTAQLSGQNSDSVEVTGNDDRGLKGDNNRSDLIDGRDLQNLADHFAQTDTNTDFDPLVDTTYDGRIDGNDLIDIGANFAQQY